MLLLTDSLLYHPLQQSASLINSHCSFSETAGDLLHIRTKGKSKVSVEHFATKEIRAPPPLPPPSSSPRSQRYFSTFLFLCEMDLFPLPDYLNQAVQGWPEFIPHKAALVAQTIKNLSAIQETQV